MMRLSTLYIIFKIEEQIGLVYAGTLFKKYWPNITGSLLIFARIKFTHFTI